MRKGTSAYICIYLPYNVCRLTVKWRRWSSGLNELFSVQRCHAGLTAASAGERGGNACHPSAARHPLSGLEGLRSLLTQALLIPQQRHQMLGFLAHVHALIPSVPVHVLKVSERLNGEGVLAALLGDPLGARLCQIIQQSQSLEQTDSESINHFFWHNKSLLTH